MHQALENSVLEQGRSAVKDAVVMQAPVVPLVELSQDTVKQKNNYSIHEAKNNDDDEPLV